MLDSPQEMTNWNLQRAGQRLRGTRRPARLLPPSTAFWSLITDNWSLITGPPAPAPRPSPLVPRHSMSWVTIIWSMVASACLTLAAVNLLVWCKKRAAWANLLFSSTAVAAAALATCELWIVRAEPPGQFGTSLRSLHVPAWALIAFNVILASNPGTAGVPPASPAQPPQRVLVLYSDERLLPANIIVDEAIRATVAASTNNQVEFHSEFLDTARFPGEAQQQRQRDFLRDKYRDRPPHLVITVSGPALDFAVKYRAEVFAGAPVVHCAVAGDPRPHDLHDDMVAEIPVLNGVAPTLELALHLQPDTRLVAVVSGTSPRDVQLADGLRDAIPAFENRVAFTWLTNLSLSELRGELSRLPAHSVVVYLSMFRDADGRTFLSRAALAEFAPASRSPIYGYYETYLGNGIVGGSMVTFEAIGRKTARLGIRILAGEDPQTAARVESHQPVPMFDWRELRRWNIREDRLPSGSVVQFRPPTLWEQHKDYVIGGLGIIIAQALTITLLLRQARRRKLA